MILEGSNPSTALGWVREDLDRLLEQIRLQLENAASNPNAGMQAIVNTASNIEHLKLTLEALVLNGAVLVLDEMLKLCDGLRHYHVDNRDEAFASLMEAIVVLPSYLDRLQAGHHDLPMLLLPVINGLRCARGDAQVQESTLFAPSLDVDLPELEIDNQALTQKESYTEFATRTRTQFENALLNWLQEQESLAHLSPLQGVCETLMHRSTRIDLRRLWWIASEVIGGLTDGSTENDVKLRRLFARLHLVLKNLSEGGEDASDPRSVDTIARSFLFHVAQARPGNPGIDLLRARFHLDELLPAQDELLHAKGIVSGRNRELYTSLGTAMQDELYLVKDALDLEMRTGEVDTERREISLEALGRLQDTLKMLGLPAASQALDDLLPEFKESEFADNEARESSLMSIAGQLLMIESALQEQVETLGEPLEDDSDPGFIDLPKHEQRRIRDHLLDEMVISVHQFQDAVKTRFGGDGNASLDEPLQQLAGALQLMGENETADLTRRLASVTAHLLKNAYAESAVAARDLVAFTDAVAALELFLAGCRDRQSNRERFMLILRENLDALPDSPETAEDVAARALIQEAQQRESAAAIKSGAIETVPEQAAETAPEGELPPIMDSELLEVFLEEYDAVNETFHHQIPEWLEALDNVDLLTDIRRGFHTLKGSGRMVGAYELGDFCWQIEELLNALMDKRIDAYADVAVMVRLAQASLPALKQRLMQQAVGLSPQAIAAIGRHAERLSRGDSSDWQTLHAQLPAFLAGMIPGAADLALRPAVAEVSSKSKLLPVLREELAKHLTTIQTLLEQVSKDRGTRTTRDHLRAIHSVAGTLAMAPEGREAEIAKALEGLLEAQCNSGAPFSVDAVWVLGASIGHLQAHLDRLDGQTDVVATEDEQELIDQIIGLTVQMETGEQVPTPLPAPERGPEEALESPGIDHETITEDALPAESMVDVEDEISGFDAEIIQIFIEEAHEVLGRSDSLLNTWRDKLDDLSLVQNLLREIHTFKGGARMAGLEALGDLSHAMESLLERIAEKSLPPSISAIQALETGCDRLQDWVGRVARGELPSAGAAISLFDQQVQDLVAVPLQASIPRHVVEESREAQKLPEVSAPSVHKGEEAAGKAQVRVDAELLDSLIKSADEVSIIRSRMEQQIGVLRSRLGEFDETVVRLKEQFRKLEIETETQIRSRYQEEARPGSEGFDPLELDRYSSMQQLSRGLSESVSDLLNLQEMLDEAARKSESFLSQQSRFTTELQEGLMQTRMVHFGSIAPRLRRLLRTAASETGKKARLQLEMVGSSDQLDRNVLERITAPLEHMLRNAIVHGIEDPATRKKLNKNATGEITITVESEATEFIVRIRDDGAGISLKAVRNKAIELGMIDRDAEPPAQQLLEFILDSGFSTSATVTGLAGRGVGMDVVNSDIKQIGGSLEIASEDGKGCMFTIRIPFTLAVMQAIGVMAGDQRYLIPLVNVSGVARLLPDDYRALLEIEQPVYTFAGEQFPVLELESLLGIPQQPLGSDNVSLLMIRAGDQKAAFRVPQLLGHREIVIKPVGPQISSVPGILGGTVSADGNVVVILDTGPLIRHALMHGARPVAPESVEELPRQTLAMVVDDSITMRKVTSRVLESHDFEVITAKDGIDATEKLQDRIPDLLLLDIEMPRMDGYELAEHVRADLRLRHIPIVMITSRSGQKHRDRAARAGANAYLTKPYKESELVTKVNALLGREG